MASKKSAKSKGYRRPQAKKPYLSKKEIIITCAVAAAIILGVVLFNLLYSDGSLKVVDGVVQAEGEHPIIANAGTTGSPSYFKVGEAHEVEGWTMTAKPRESDDKINNYTYEPEGEAGAADSVTISAVASEAATFVNKYISTYSTVPGYELSAAQTTQVGDREALWFTLRTDPETFNEAVEAAKEEKAEAQGEAAEAEPEAAEETADGAAEEEPAEEAAEEAAEGSGEEAAQQDDGYDQMLFACVQNGDRSISISVMNEAASEADYVEDEQLVEVLEQFVASLTYETK